MNLLCLVIALLFSGCYSTDAEFSAETALFSMRILYVKLPTEVQWPPSAKAGNDSEELTTKTNSIRNKLVDLQGNLDPLLGDIPEAEFEFPLLGMEMHLMKELGDTSRSFLRLARKLRNGTALRPGIFKSNLRKYVVAGENLI